MDGQNLKKPVHGFAIASMIIGILSLLLFCWNIDFGLILGILLGIMAIVYAIIAKKKGRSGMATAGLVCGIISVALGVILIVLFFVALAYFDL